MNGKSNGKPQWLALSLVVSMVLAGCASTPKPDPQVGEARAELDALKGNPSVQNSAPGQLLDAEQALKRAEKAHEEEMGTERDHQTYLARRHMEIARVTDERNVTEQEITDLGAERDRLALAARESELAEKRSELAASKEELAARESQLAEERERVARERARSRELQAELAALEAKPTDRGMLVALDDMFFDTAGATIAPGATPTLDKVVDFLGKNSDQEIIIEGHTDAVGAADYNQGLSEQRAEAVKEEIVARGIDPDRIVAEGYGEARPVASNATSGGRQLNRRVEIVFPSVGQ